MKGTDSVMFSKKSDEWETPKSLFAILDQRFHFNADMAATYQNKLCGYFSHDAMNNEWGTVSFVNPPYSQIGKFIKKAYEESLKGKLVVVLIPARTDTKYFHDYCMKACEIIFIRGRLQFDNRTLPSWREDGSHKRSSAPFPSMVVVFRTSLFEGSPVISSMNWK